MKLLSVFLSSRAVVALVASAFLHGACLQSEWESEQGEPRDLEALIAIPPLAGAADAQDWPSYGRDLHNTRHNPAEPDHTGVLLPGIRWVADIGGDITGTPAVVGSAVYVGAGNGQVAALDTATGSVLWSVNIDGEIITSSPAVVGGRVLISTLAGNLWALDQATGATLWTTDLTYGMPDVQLFGSPVESNGVVFIGISSNQEYLSENDLGFYGALAAVQASSGSILWTRFFASGDQYGAAIWTTPAVAAGRAFIGTGNPYADPPTPYGDSMVAVRTGNGAIAWYKQWWPDDVFTLLTPDGPDYDFGASPNLFYLNDRLVMGEGSKSGDYHVMDALNGTVVWSARPTNGGLVGGFLGSTAYADGRIHAVVNNGPSIKDPRPPLTPTGGLYVSLSAADGSVLYSEVMPTTLSSPCVAGGVVYYVDLAGTIYARNAATGGLLWVLPTGESSASGPAVSRGTLYVGTGLVSGFTGDANVSGTHHLFAIDIDGI